MSADESQALEIAAASPAGLAYVTSQGRWKPLEHLLVVDDYLMKLAAREISRLIVEVPIRHGKSELVSRYFPAWYLGRNPDEQIILASYESDFARSWGRKAREVLAEFGPRVFGQRPGGQTSAADWWTVEGHEGVMTTGGIKSSITGKGADLLIIDDPVKNADEAQSEREREKNWDQWQSTLRSRLQPGGVVVVVMARWHEDDLAGRLQANEDPNEPWTICRLPAVAEENDLMGRKPGEALCPELFDEGALERTRVAMGRYWFSALLQQKPTPAEGLLFKRPDFRYWREATTGDATYYVVTDGEVTRRFPTTACSRFQTTDVAASDKTTADYTVVSTWAVTPAKDLLLIDCERQQFESLNVPSFLKRKNMDWGRPPMWIETFGAGRAPYKQLVKDGYPVLELKAEQGIKTDKIARAFPAIAAVEAHKVFFPGGEPKWMPDFDDELVGFPNSKNDDMVDTLSYAVQKLQSMGGMGRQNRPTFQPLSAGIWRADF